MAAALVVSLVVAACAGDGESTDPTSTPGTDQAIAGDQAPSETEASSAPVSGNQDGILCWAAPPAAGDGGISFTDASSAMELVDPLKGMRAHAAAWSDINGDLRPDLVVGTFATARTDVYLERGADGPSPTGCCSAPTVATPWTLPSPTASGGPAARPSPISTATATTTWCCPGTSVPRTGPTER